MDIIFASSKGSQYKYFRQLSKSLSYKCKVVTLSPVFFPMLFSNGLTRESISKGVKFHQERKKSKIGRQIPGWVWTLYKLKSIIKFVWLYSKFYALFSKETPKCVGLWNGHRLPEMAISLSARKLGIKVLFFENGLLPSSTTADFRGVNDCNSVPRSSRFYCDYYDNNHCVSFSAERLEVRKPHKAKAGGVLTTKGVNKFIFVPFQVSFDSQVLINSNWVRTMEEFYGALVDVLANIKDTELCFVIKEHPSDPKSYRDLYCRHPRIIFSNENTEDLIRRSEGVLTINSSVGMESLLLEKKVVVVGEACFKVPGLALKADCVSELSLQVGRLLDGWSPDERVLLGFSNYIANQYVIPGSWQDQIKGVADEHLKAMSWRIHEGLSVNRYYSQEKSDVGRLLAV